MSKLDTKISKFFSLILRHDPSAANITLDDQGWCNIEDLILGSNDKGFNISITDIQRVVKNSDKKRFSISDDGQLIRAVQGHSNKQVDIDYKPIEPPEFLYHGTADRFISSIMEQGIKSGKRQYVHLSADQETAIKVGQRHGKAVILKINTKKMYENGHIFHQADNGVWLCDFIPTSFILK